jgi:hypothetical protein
MDYEIYSSFGSKWNYENRGFCNNMDLSDHAQILYTRGFEDEEFKEKKSQLSETNGSRDIWAQSMNSYRRNVKNFMFF